MREAIKSLTNLKGQKIHQTNYAKEIKELFVKHWIPAHNKVPHSVIQNVENAPLEKWIKYNSNIVDNWNDADEMNDFFKKNFNIELYSERPDANDMIDIQNLQSGFYNTPLDDRAARYITNQLTDLVNQWNRTEWYYPGTALVQSSGSGKSRSVVALEELGVHVVYCSFMNGKGFPTKSAIADDIQRGDDVLFARYYYACLEVVAEIIAADKVKEV